MNAEKENRSGRPSIAGDVLLAMCLTRPMPEGMRITEASPCQNASAPPNQSRVKAMLTMHAWTGIPGMEIKKSPNLERFGPNAVYDSFSGSKPEKL